MSSRPTSNRREFLQGKSAVAAASAVAQTAANGLEQATSHAAPAEREAYLLRFSRRAMACEFEVLVNAHQYDHASDLALQGLDLVDRVDQQLSIYRDDSEICALNRHAGTQPVPVESGMYELLELAIRLHGETDGALDITSGPLSKVWGFFQRAGRMPSDRELHDARMRVGSEHMILDPSNQSVQFELQGLEINFNSMGKGIALDRVAQLMAEGRVRDFVVHGGQSSVIARGSSAATPQAGWSVGLRHPSRPSLRLAEFWLKNQALGTSGSGTQSFHFQGRRYGHLIDPRSGHPAQHVLSATVIAPSAVLADALSTAFYILGPDGVQDYCNNHPNIGSVVVCPGPREGSIRLHEFGMNNCTWRRIESADTE